MSVILKTLVFLVVTLFALSINACSSRTDYAPISAINTIEPLPKNGIYRVSQGETLYSIAWRYGLDYRDLAGRNHLNKPYHLHSGQIIYLTNARLPRLKPAASQKTLLAEPRNDGHVSGLPRPKPKPVQNFAPQPKHNENPIVSTWYWPTQGRIISTFSSDNKGINISGEIGNPIFATAAGKIVYSGHGLHGYGNLIIIKHNNQFLSAYAHNKTILVKEGDWVESGQKIAEMGNTGSKNTFLHFEIRRNGQPVNPLISLTRKV